MSYNQVVLSYCPSGIRVKLEIQSRCPGPASRINTKKKSVFQNPGLVWHAEPFAAKSFFTVLSCPSFHGNHLIVFIGRPFERLLLRISARWAHL
jgi:hypothetical protein